MWLGQWKSKQLAETIPNHQRWPHLQKGILYTKDIMLADPVTYVLKLLGTIFYIPACNQSLGAP